MEELKRLLEYTGVDVEQLVDDYTTTLKENNNSGATKEGSIIALKEWAIKKEWIIRQIMAMPGYNGNFQSVIAINVPQERTVSDTRTAVLNIWRNLFDSGIKVLSKKDSDGKTVEDYVAEELKAMPTMVRLADLSKHSGKALKSLEAFMNDGYTKESASKRSKLSRLFDIFKEYNSSRLTDVVADNINKIDADIRAAENMKTTRALGKIIKMYGFEDKTAGSVYSRDFISNYCEIMKEGGRLLLFVVSCNPIDYLKMSIGEFTSCHNINNGGWRSGTISYMLDKVSIVTYTVKPNQTTKPNKDGEVFLSKDRPELFKKIHRNMFHWDELHRLVQSRVYPQSYDGTTDMQRVFRHEVQRRISIANGWEAENWTFRKRKHTEFVQNGPGHTNYPDWYYPYMGANLSTPGHANDPYSTEPMLIGAKPTCVKCGAKHTNTGNMFCDEHYCW